MIPQRTRPPLLETSFEVFDHGVFTPNDQFFVGWHWAVIPAPVDVTAYRLAVHGHVNQMLPLSLAEGPTMPPVELAAVNQCSGNSPGLFQPRVTGGEWLNGAMGNAGAVQVRFNGLNRPVAVAAVERISAAADRARMVLDLLGQVCRTTSGCWMPPDSNYWMKMAPVADANVPAIASRFTSRRTAPTVTTTSPSPRLRR
jgi:DMSO/TMAO reductase YedYZ molybdopterin-dependent catalytic subunit